MHFPGQKETNLKTLANFFKLQSISILQPNTLICILRANV